LWFLLSVLSQSLVLVAIVSRPERLDPSWIVLLLNF